MKRLWQRYAHAKLFSKCASCQDGSARFCQIVGRTYRGETQAVMLARNVIAFLGLKRSHQCSHRVFSQGDK